MSQQTESGRALEWLQNTVRGLQRIYTVSVYYNPRTNARTIRTFIAVDGRIMAIDRHMCLAFPEIFKFDSKREGTKAGGSGMDMGFFLVSQLSSKLFKNRAYQLQQEWL